VEVCGVLKSLSSHPLVFVEILLDFDFGGHFANHFAVGRLL
jgi:hypothetical protein